MKAKVYVYFPESDLAFHNLDVNAEAYNDVIKELYAIKAKLKTHSDFVLCYDESNVASFVDAANGYLAEVYLANTKKRLYHIIGSQSENVNLPRLRNSEIIYVNWNSGGGGSVLNSPFIVAEATEDSELDSEHERTICICLGNSLKIEKEELRVIKDAVHLEPLPLLVRFAATNNDVGFVKWLLTLPVGSFSLKNNRDFDPLNKYWPKTGQRIYKHIPTGNHWYFDFYHKDNKIHYEVFDNSGDVYLGEAGIDGQIKPGTNVGNKKIGRIIH